MVHWVRQMKKKLVSQKGLLDRAKDALAQKQKLEEYPFQSHFDWFHLGA